MTSLHCCGCRATVTPRKTTGAEIYPSRPDLAALPAWKCDGCQNYVGAHKEDGRPLGCIPTPELRAARQALHHQMDPLWAEHGMSRRAVYTDMAKRMGQRDFHIANTRSLKEVHAASAAVAALIAENEAKRLADSPFAALMALKRPAPPEAAKDPDDSPSPFLRNPNWRYT